MKEKSPPNIKLVLGLFLGIVVFFGGIIATQEYTLATGQEIKFETIPVDPRDLLRGDYVTLRYAFEQDPILRDYITQNNIPTKSSIYLLFEKDIDGRGKLSRVSENRPKSGIFLKVETQPQDWWQTGIQSGISKYFVPEGTGREIERIVGDMNVTVKIDKFGLAKITDLEYQGKPIDPKSFRFDTSFQE